MTGLTRLILNEVANVDIRRIFTINFSGKGGSRKYQALLSRNTIINELPYRVTWFDQNMSPMGHIDLCRNDAVAVLAGKIPDNFDARLRAYIDYSFVRISK